MSQKRDTNYPNYYYKTIPDDKDPSDYDHDERCAAILDKILEVGDPYFLDHKELSKKYDVHRSTITRNIQDIAKSIKQNSDEDKLMMKIESSYNSLLKKATDTNDYSLQRKITKDYEEWLFNSGRLSKEPERVEGDINITIEEWDDGTEDS